MHENITKRRNAGSYQSVCAILLKEGLCALILLTFVASSLVRDKYGDIGVDEETDSSSTSEEEDEIGDVRTCFYMYAGNNIISLP